MASTDGAICALMCHLRAPHKMGASHYRYVENSDRFFENTVSISPSEGSGRSRVSFEVSRLGDLGHTFVLKGKLPPSAATTTLVDEFFESFELCGYAVGPGGEKEKTFAERMTLRTNNSLARASGMEPSIAPSGEFSIPLMLRETVDPYRCHLPLLAASGSGLRDSVQFMEFRISLVVNGARWDNDWALDVDYVYLDREARYALAKTDNQMPMAICSYAVSHRETIFSHNFKNWVISLKDGAVGFADRVTGLLIHPVDPKASFEPQRIEVLVNRHLLKTWTAHDRELSWQKVGLKNPGDGSILIPFSRDMWSDPENAGCVNFGAIDHVDLRIIGAPTPLETGDREMEMEIEITALNYEIRVLDAKNHTLATENLPLCK